MTLDGVLKWAVQGIIPEARWPKIMVLAEALHRKEPGWTTITANELHGMNETKRALKRAA